MNRPLEVTAIALYHGLFSAALLATLMWQGLTHPPSDGWIVAAPVIAMLALVSFIPAVICLGLWVMDDAARIAAIIFTISHLLLTGAWLQHTAVHWLPCARIAVDVLIIVVLVLPRIKLAFEIENRLLLPWDDLPKQ